jgi:eukaryotic-like serine/threonine-protein kinase
MQAGELLAGKYRIEAVLGEGGMGRVVAAVHEQLQQRVAVKFLLPEALRHPEAVKRFLREARAAVKLRSLHVGRVIDVGTLDGGEPYMVMEYLDGNDLHGELQRHGQLAPAIAVDYVLQACEAIAEAHALGIVHRDLKPANLFLTRGADGSPLVKVLDFGISKAAPSDPDFNMTRTQAVMGSPGYMSPEQLRSTRDVDARSDIWAIGVVLYELVSGGKPFRSDTFSELCLKVAMDPPAPLVVPGLPDGLALVILRCLEKNAEDRWANLAELAAALAPYGPGHSHAAADRIARVLSVSPSPASYSETAAAASAPTTLGGAASQSEVATSRRGGKLLYVAAIAGVAIVIGGAAAMMTRSNDGAETNAVESAVPAGAPIQEARSTDAADLTETDTAAAPGRIDAGILASEEDQLTPGSAEATEPRAGETGPARRESVRTRERRPRRERAPEAASDQAGARPKQPADSPSRFGSGEDIYDSRH